MRKPLCLFLLMFAAYAATAQTATKKVMFEEYTGTWCPNCPWGTVMADSMKKVFGDRLIVVANHYNDKLEVPEGRKVRDELYVFSFPSATLDRYRQPAEQRYWVTSDKWHAYVQPRLSDTAIASVSFSDCSASSDSTYEMDVAVVFNKAPVAGVPLKLNVYVLEDSIAAIGDYLQFNNNPNIGSGAGFLYRWHHNNTLRMALGGAWGLDPFPQAPHTGIVYRQHFTFTRPEDWNAARIRLVAYLAYDGTIVDNQKEVLNCEEKALSSFPKNVTFVATIPPVSIQSIAPNPAAANNMVKLSFNTVGATRVSLSVYNSIGQIVAATGSDIYASGTHTLSFRPADYRLSPGLYFLKLTGAAASDVRRLEVE